LKIDWRIIMDKKHLVFLFLFILIVLMISVVLTSKMRVYADSGSLFWLNPASTSISPSGSAEVVLQLDSITNVYGLQFDLSFDPSVLSVVDADAGKPGVQISTGSCPQPDFVVVNDVDGTAGTIEYAATQLNPTLPCDGGEVATIEFECVVEGDSSVVSFTDSLISDPDGLPISHTTQNATVTCDTGFDAAQADFTGSPTSGDAPLDVDFNNLSSGDYDTCTWEFGDGGTSNSCGNPSYTYQSSGVYTASLMVSGDGGTDTKTRDNYVKVNPVISSLSPEHAIAGDPGFTLKVYGGGFVDGETVIQWNGEDRTTDYVSSTELQASISAGDIGTAGTAEVRVSHKSAAVTSSAVSFQIYEGEYITFLPYVLR
jgi:PKD repeat protein